MTTASKDGLDLIAVTLNGPDDWNDHINMYEYGFKHYELVKVLKKGTIKDLGDTKGFYKKKVYLKRDFYYPVADKDERDDFKEWKIKLQEPKDEWRDGRTVPSEVIGKAVALF